MCEGNLVGGALGINAYKGVREAVLLSCDTQSPQLESLELPRISDWLHTHISQLLDMNCPCQWDINLDEAGPVIQGESAVRGQQPTVPAACGKGAKSLQGDLGDIPQHPPH